MSQNLYLGLSFPFKNWVTFCKILKNHFCLQSKMHLFVDVIFRLKTNIYVSFAYGRFHKKGPIQIFSVFWV